MRKVDTTFGILGAVAAACTIAGTAYALYRWIGGYITIEHLQDPAKLVTKRSLGYRDVALGLEAIIRDASNFNPDAIYGINRGGAIVGGIVAKALGLPQVFILAVNCDMPSRKVEEQRKGKAAPGKRLLVIDDAMRKGEHMREAAAYLKSNYPGVELRRIVLLKVAVAHPGPEKVAFSERSVECCPFVAKDSTVMLPWDPQ